MRLSELSDQAADAFRQAGNYIDDLSTPTLRLGVTGLARAGKTVFITALVEALTNARAHPKLPMQSLPGFRAFLEPQPDDDVPRFAIEDHLAALSGTPDTPGTWPESTRHISQLRVTLEWEAQDWARRTAGIGRRLHLDIVDYPGEWLADIGLLDLDYAAWSRLTTDLANDAPSASARDRWLAFDASQRLTDATPEQIAIDGTAAFTAYLAEQKANGPLPSSAGPGRFLMPGEFDGSPLLTFFPFIPGDADHAQELHQLLRRRFESYKDKVVRPFFEKHFARLDRQIVLADVLGALNRGPAAVLEMENALERALKSFRPGRQTWLGRLLGHRIDRILFAATKADHLHRANHDRLRDILGKMVDRAKTRAESAGAVIAVAALAALRATEDVERTGSGNQPPLPCIRGIPVDGEKLADKPLQAGKAVTLFPGDLPKEPLDAFDPELLPPGSLNFVRFRPNLETRVGTPPQIIRWPHVGLDTAVTFLLGDRLA